MPVAPSIPGVYVQQPDDGESKVITGVATSITAFIGRTARGNVNAATTIVDFGEFEALFGGLERGLPITYAVRDFFVHGGSQAVIVRVIGGDGSTTASRTADGPHLASGDVIGTLPARTGLYALESVDLFNLLVIPPDPQLGGDDDMKRIYQVAATYCASRRAMLIADPLDAWNHAAKRGRFDEIAATDFAIDPIGDRRAVFSYFPRVILHDPPSGEREGRCSASGIIAGMFAAMDAARGVWKAPAGPEARMNGVVRPEHQLTDVQSGVLEAAGINALRALSGVGTVIWGSRTLAGADALADDYQYVPVRRLTDFIEASVSRGIRFAVFEPNAEPLWSQLRLSIGTFLSDLARRGAFSAYDVSCDATTTSALDIAQGRVNVVVTFAPLEPAESILLSLSQDTQPGGD